MDYNITMPKSFAPLFKPKRYKVLSGGRGSGKSYNIAQALLLKGCKEKLRILCTREIQNSIADSVHKLLTDLIEKHKFPGYKYTNKTITNVNTGTEFIYRGLHMNFQEIKSTEGIDIAWCEEAHAIKQASIDLLIPTIRKQNSEIWFSFNRFLELDPVYETFVNTPRDDVWHYNSTYRDNPFISDILLDEMKFMKENDYDKYLHVWEGEPLYQSEDSIISREALKKATERPKDTFGKTEVGVDVARFGQDRTVLFKRKGLAVIDYKIYKKLSVPEVANKVKQFCSKDDIIKVDSTGVGGGVCDILRQDGYSKTYDIVFGGAPKNKNKYDMLISEAWFEFSEMVKEISIPKDQELFHELTSRKWRLDRRGRRCVESKDEYKKRGNKSPDLADAIILAFYRHGKIATFREDDAMSDLKPMSSSLNSNSW